MAYASKLPYGLRKNGEGERLLHISEILPHESGLKCNCFCPNCGIRLQAKLPKTKEDFTPRFAHHDADTCDYATETALHMKAKEIIEKEKRMAIPKVIADYKGRSKEVFSEREITFEHVVLERRLGNIIPDIIAYKNKHPLMIEIKITHGIDDFKFEKIEKLGISTLEIDLSDLDTNFDPDFLYNEIILNTNNKYWVYNSVAEKGKEKLKEEYLKTLEKEKEEQRKAENKRKLAEKKIEKKAERVAQLLDVNQQQKLKMKWENSFHIDPIWIETSKRAKISTSNIPEFLDLEIPGEIVFGCDRKIWQSYIFYRYINEKVKIFREKTYPISVKRIQKDVKEVFKDRLIKDLVYTKDLNLYQNIPDLAKVIYDYLKKLIGYGYLVEQRSGHYFHAKFIILDKYSVYEMRFVPTSMPEYKIIKVLIKNCKWTECYELIQELLIKYNRSNQSEYYNALAYLFDGIVLKNRKHPDFKE